MEQPNTPAERENYVLAVLQDAFERSEDAKRRYRQGRAQAVDAVAKQRRRSNLIRSKYGKGFAFTLVAAAIIIGVAKNGDRIGIDRTHLAAVSTFAQETSQNLVAKAQDVYGGVVARVSPAAPEITATATATATKVASAAPTPAFPVESVEGRVEPDVVGPVADVAAGQAEEAPPELVAVVAPPADELKDLVVDTATIIDVPFARAISDLGPKGKKAVAGVAKTLGNPRLIEVIGMSDRSEDKALATVRSVSVVDALVRAGIDPTIIKFSGVSFNSTEDGGEVTGARITAFAESASGIGKIKPTAITPGAALSEVKVPDRKPAFPLIPLPLSKPDSSAVASLPSPQKAPSRPEAPTPEPQQEQAVDDGLSAAIEAAARRLAGGNSGQKPQKIRPSVDVDIRVREPQATVIAQAAPESEKPTDTTYSIVRVLEQGLLIRRGNSVQLIKHGKPMPDGKTLDSTDAMAGTYQFR